mmetsp:Transcript_10161/g.26992  ORF Transcript_10161/g.26992 Transcript_10161/m.26992 type:complete len:109 (+) Transcript_10161:151-477(+)
MSADHEADCILWVTVQGCGNQDRIMEMMHFLLSELKHFIFLLCPCTIWGTIQSRTNQDRTTELSHLLISELMQLLLFQCRCIIWGAIQSCASQEANRNCFFYQRHYWF